jgi:hypothetical protein
MSYGTETKRPSAPSSAGYTFDDTRRDGIRFTPRRRRGGRAGDVAECRPEPRCFRGEVVAQDLDLSDPRQLRTAASRPRAPAGTAV